ncbi:MAG: alpha-glucan family phosphorylase [Planctomycetota bacterium]
MTFHLFEVSWEVCNKVGGIYTVVTSKARTLSEKFGDRYLTLGPMLLDLDDAARSFQEESGFDAFRAACQRRGVDVRIGRWNIAGSPRTILVGFSNLYAQKDRLLAHLWERYQVDSLLGGWDYLEPVLFGHAAGIAIEEWYRLHVAPSGEGAVAQFHEWMTASGLLHLKHVLPQIGTIFTTHATMLGRALSSTGSLPKDALRGRTPEQAAREIGVPAKHSMEGVAAREADVFTTVSGVTADEAELLHGRRPEPILPNGIDLEWVQHLAAQPGRETARERLTRVASALVGEDVSDAAFLATSGRYEFHNKGIDVLLDTAKILNDGSGRRVVVFVMVPGGSSGLRRDLVARLEDGSHGGGPLGVTTHELFDADNDPVVRRCAELGLDNAVGSRVKVVQIPAYLPASAPLDLSYESALAAMDMTAFPSFYEPWGYTPAESISVGVPTVTTELAGFGVWARKQDLDAKSGVTVIDRVGLTDTEVAHELADQIEAQLASPRTVGERQAACLAAAGGLAWSHLIAPYEEAFAKALSKGRTRASHTRPRFALPSEPNQPASTNAPRLRRLDVAASLPEALGGLERLSRNLWWCWDNDAPALFEEISPRLWRECGQNPVTFLRRAYPQDLDRVAHDATYLARLQRALGRFDAYMNEAPRSLGQGAVSREHPVAYFCFEFGIHPSLPIYSGGLGILAGDHLKSASDLNLPLIAVGLFYSGGYVRQQLAANGEQLSLDVHNQPADLPMKPVLGEDGLPLEISLALPSGRLRLRAWQVDVGRVRLFLLDSNLDGNDSQHRSITHRLYAGDQEQRLRQEIVLGRGGVRLLQAMGVSPRVLHMNEGHAAFAALEQVSILVQEQNLTFPEARALVREGTAFTTHTPVPAGHDVFPEELMRRYFFDVPQRLGLPWEKFLALGADANGHGAFNMSYLCMNLANFTNGVAQMHGEVSRNLLHPFWSSLLVEEVPVTHVTNGVHLPTWTAGPIARLLGAESRMPKMADFAKAEADVQPAALWAVRQELRHDLIEAACENLERSYHRRQDDPKLLGRIQAGLRTPGALLIGFARRFAPYKRATLLLEDEERLARLVNDPERPVRFLFSGKAHPADGAGKDLVRRVAELTKREPFAGKIVFLEDYDIEIAKKLVQGVDVWLNNPIPPLEASGTSGMKSAANGGLNLSVLDGWWIEGCDGHNGWGVGPERSFQDQGQQNRLDNEQILRLLEDEVVPLFFARDEAGVPQAWLRRSLHALSSLPTVFSTDRMVAEYAERAYEPLGISALRYGGGDLAAIRHRAAEQRRLRQGMEELVIEQARTGRLEGLRTGDSVHVEVDLRLGSLCPSDIVCELVHGRPQNGKGLVRTEAIELSPTRDTEGLTTFAGAYTLDASGAYQWGIRIRPKAGKAGDLDLMGVARWA